MIEEPLLGETGKGISGNDDVIDKWDPDDVAGFCQLTRDSDVFAAGVGAFAWMAVKDQDGGGVFYDRPAEHHPRFDDGARKASLACDVRIRDDVRRV